MRSRVRMTSCSYAAAVAAPFAALALRLFLLPVLAEHAPLMPFAVAIAVAAWLGGLGPGLLATGLSVALVDFFFLPPVNSFSLPSRSESIGLGTFAIAGIIISAIGEASHRGTRRLREQAEAMRESEEEFRAMFTRSSVAKAQFEPGTARFLRVNPAFCELMGYSEAELLQRSFGDITHPDDLSISLTSYQKLLRGEVAQLELDKRYLRADGTVIWVHVTANVIHDSSGRPTRTLAVLQDITARKQAEQALLDRERRLRIFFESDMVGTLYWNTDGQITDANNKFLEMVGYTREELTAGNVRWADMTPPEYRAADEHALTDLQATGVDTAYEKEFIRKDNTRVPVIIGAAMFDDSHEDGVAFVLDITERRRTQAALAEAKAELERVNAELEKRVAQRTAELRETIAHLEGFSYSITHDLRAPLRAMTSFASILQEEYRGKLGSSADDYLRRINDAAHRMDHLIVDVLQYSRLARDELPLGRVEIMPLLQDIVHQYPDIAAHRERIHIESNCADTHVRGNLAALTQVFSNLLANAVKFVPAGRTPVVHLCCKPTGTGWMRISVTDNGLGIPPEHRDKIWGVFHRLHGSGEYPGTGIGLSIVTKAMERMGGKIGLESEVNRGSTFWIELPKE